MNEEEIKKTAREDDTFYLMLDEVVEALEKYARKNENVCIEFNEEKFYSLIDDRDSCYLRLTGKNYSDYLSAMEEIKKSTNRPADERVPEWIKRGQAVVYPQQKKLWKQFVESNAGDDFNGNDIEYTLKIMESLAKDGDMEKAFELYQEAVKAESFCGFVARKNVRIFSDKGPEFYRFISKKENFDLSKADEEMLKRIEKRYQSFKQELEETAEDEIEM